MSCDHYLALGTCPDCDDLGRSPQRQAEEGPVSAASLGWSVPPLTAKGFLSCVDLDHPGGVSVTVRVPVSEAVARKLSRLMLETGLNIDVTFPSAAQPKGKADP